MNNKTAIGIAIGFFLTKSLLRKQPGVRGVYKEVPQFFECNDGYLTTGSCSWHGGFKSRNPLPLGAGGSGLLNIQDIPLSQIHIDRQLFQGREKAFSQRSVDNIVNDVLNGHFAWENLDPITLWRSPDGKLYLLSGHSRLRAFEVLAEMRASANGKGFDRIPAKIRSGALDDARRLALESNTLSTKETDIERAAYYRKLRQDGVPEKELLAQIRKNEGRNAGNIYAYTFLSPTGKTWATLRQFAESEDTSANIAKSLAKWIGAARREYPMLTGDHERELHDWLFEHRGYGSGAGQVSRESDFQERVGRFIARNTEFGVFDQGKPLNILNSLLKSPAEQEYDRQIDDLQKQIRELDNQIKLKTKSLTAQKATKDDLQRILSPMEARLRNLRADLQRMILQKQNIIEYGKKEASLFGRRRRKNY